MVDILVDFEDIALLDNFNYFDNSDCLDNWNYFDFLDYFGYFDNSGNSDNLLLDLDYYLTFI